MAEEGRKGFKQCLAGWFPERKLLLLGQDRVSTITISHRAQLGAAVALGVLCLWSATAGAGLIWTVALRAPAAAPALRAALAGAQARIAALDSEYKTLAATRDQAAAQTLAQADQIRDAAIVQAAAARAELEQAGQQAAQGGQASAHDDTALVEQLAAQTRQTIAQVDGIIKATGLNPDHLAAEGVRVITQSGANGHAAGAATEAGTVGALLKQPGVPVAEQVAALHLATATGQLQTLLAAFAQIPLSPPLTRIAISSPFGYRASPFTGAREFHVGVDLTGPVGTPVYATAPGVVVFAGQSTGYGNLIIIDHGYGLSTRYSHLEKMLLPVGATVALHQEIALLGNTGWSTGPHLLYETRVDGAPQNPLNFMKVTSNVQN
jgi:murein DD-endopeptidase MepM/ murein hydrolase activator NlpD